MSDLGDRPVDDASLAEGLSRLAASSDAAAPSVAVLARRVERRRRRRRAGAAAGVAVVVLVAGIGLAALIDRKDAGQRSSVLASSGGRDRGTGAAPASVFTVGEVPRSLSFRSCGASAGDGDPSVVHDITCQWDDPETAAVDGVRLTRVIGGATPALRDAWAAGDAAAALAASGGGDPGAQPRFTTVGDTTVLALDAPSDLPPAAFRYLVGEDLVDIGASGATEPELARIVDSTTMAPPAGPVVAALDALPAGSSVLIQGPRPLWSEPNQLDPGTRSPFGGTTYGADLQVGGSADVVDLDVTSDVDADAILDGLVAQDIPLLTEVQVGGRRGLELAAGGALPVTMPEPRFGPQLIVRADPRRLVRIQDPQGTSARIRQIAGAIS